MRPFEYISPHTRTQAISLLGATWGNTEVLAGGTDLLALMKDDVVAPRRLVNIKEIADLRGVSSNTQGLRVGALTTLGELADDANVKTELSRVIGGLTRSCQPADSEHGYSGRESLPAAALLVFPQWVRTLAKG